MDVLGSYLEDCCVLGEDGSIPGKDLYQDYETWCTENGETPMKPNSFCRRLKEHGIRQVKIHGARYWHDIKLLVEDDRVTDKREGADLDDPHENSPIGGNTGYFSKTPDQTDTQHPTKTPSSEGSSSTQVQIESSEKASKLEA
jgi:phage/plasmid-associated DNA primase